VISGFWWFTSRHRGHFTLGSAALSPSTIDTDAAEHAHVKQNIWPQVRETGSNTVSCHWEVRWTKSMDK